MASKPDKLNGHAFHIWKTKVKGYLMEKILWSVVRATLTAVNKGSTNISLEKEEQALGIV